MSEKSLTEDITEMIKENPSNRTKILILQEYQQEIEKLLEIGIPKKTILDGINKRIKIKIGWFVFSRFCNTEIEAKQPHQNNDDKGEKE